MWNSQEKSYNRPLSVLLIIRLRSQVFCEQIVNTRLSLVKNEGGWPNCFGINLPWCYGIKMFCFIVLHQAIQRVSKTARYDCARHALTHVEKITCTAVFYQRIENDNEANQIHGFTIDY